MDIDDRSLTIAHVELAWLASEWPAGHEADRWLVGPTADPADRAQNERRHELLHERHHLLREIPVGASIRRVRLERADIPSLFIVPDASWYLDTGGSFSLVSAPNHVRLGRRPQDSQLRVNHGERIAAFRTHLARHPHDAGDLILLSAGGARHTILDGNHRAVAMLQLDVVRLSAIPWSAILISSPEMTGVRLHIESDAAQAAIDTWRAWAEQGLLDEPT